MRVVLAACIILLTACATDPTPSAPVTPIADAANPAPLPSRSDAPLPVTPPVSTAREGERAITSMIYGYVTAPGRPPGPGAYAARLAAQPGSADNIRLELRFTSWAGTPMAVERATDQSRPLRVQRGPSQHVCDGPDCVEISTAAVSLPAAALHAAATAGRPYPVTVRLERFGPIEIALPAPHVAAILAAEARR
ncbi:MAG TPA: hypothetical protein VGM87_26055 [Roseomonas sp.]|jgi:hypothetical protein